MKGKYLWIIVTRKHSLLTFIVALALAANPSVALLAAQVPGPQYLLSFQKTDGETRDGATGLHAIRMRRIGSQVRIYRTAPETQPSVDW